MNILFICSRNQWRSPTAESIYKDRQDLKVRSAGTEPSAKIKVTEKLIEWADIIFVMEKRHKERLAYKFPNITNSKSIHILGIPDEYGYMDEELISSIKLSVGPYLNGWKN